MNHDSSQAGGEDGGRDDETHVWFYRVVVEVESLMFERIEKEQEGLEHLRISYVDTEREEGGLLPF